MHFISATPLNSNLFCCEQRGHALFKSGFPRSKAILTTFTRDRIYISTGNHKSFVSFKCVISIFWGHQQSSLLNQRYNTHHIKVSLRSQKAASTTSVTLLSRFVSKGEPATLSPPWNAFLNILVTFTLIVVQIIISEIKSV